MYRLSSNMADRLIFDEAVRIWARECVQHAEGPLTKAALEAYFRGLDVEVDDAEEARARFDDAFIEAWLDEGGEIEVYLNIPENADRDGWRVVAEKVPADLEKEFPPGSVWFEWPPGNGGIAKPGEWELA